LEKCEFRAIIISYLGYRQTPDGILPGSDKLRELRNSKAPSTVQEIRLFMGLCNLLGHMSGISLKLVHISDIKKQIGKVETFLNNAWRHSKKRKML
jgi:hypothetical protein